MGAAEIALNTPRAEQAAAPPTKQKGLPDQYRKIEYNLPTTFDRCKNETGYYWIYVSPKVTNLTARIYPDVDRKTIKIAVFEIRPSQDFEEGTEIYRWTINLAMDEDWKMKLADYSGRVMKQADKQPKCAHCGGFLLLRCRRNDRRAQFFGCCHYPDCNGTATIEEYEAKTDKLRPQNNFHNEQTAAAP